MYDFSKRTDTLRYLTALIETLKDVSIQAIFTLSAIGWNNQRGYRMYDTDSEIYILFCNGMCLVIDFLFIDCLSLEYRALTDEERTRYSKTNYKDYFNTSQDIYDPQLHRIKRTETVRLDYSYIKDVIIEPVTQEYEKWINGDFVSITPTAETFDTITLILANGNRISIRAGDAITDGMTFFDSPDADCVF